MRIRHFKRRQKITAIFSLAFFVVAGFWYAAEPTTPLYAQQTSISYRGSTHQRVNTAASIAVPRYSSLALNDVMIASAVTNTTNGDVINPPAGWTQVDKTVQGTLVLYTWYKVANSADLAASSFTFTFPGGAKQAVATILVFNGVEITGPINAHGAQGSSVVSTTVTAPSITTTKPNTMLVGIFAQLGSPTSNFGPYGGATLPALIERDDYSSSGSGSQLALAMASAIFNGTGATGIKTATASKSSAPSIGHLIALRLTNQQPAVSITAPSALTFNCPTGLTGISDDSVTFAGSATDPDGTIATHVWTKSSGPFGGNDTITSPGSYTTTITWPYPTTPPVPGTYNYRLTATDDETAVGYATASVTIPPNAAPIVSPVSPPNPPAVINVTGRGVSGVTTVNLGVGWAVTDLPASCPQPIGLQWTKVGVIPANHPGGNAITNPTSLQTTVTDIDTTAGATTTYRLTATDYLGLQITKNVEVVVPSNFPPEVTNCRATPWAITLPDQNRVTVSCTVTDSDSFVWDVLWTKGKFPVGHPQYVPNPPGDTIVYPTGHITDVTYDIAAGAGGAYNYLLTATDDFGAIATGTASVVVSVAGNALPNVVAVATPSSISLPGETSITLDGSQTTDSNGPLPLTYTWTRQPGGPTGGTIESPNSVTTNVTGLSNEGTYTYRLTVKDAWGGTGTDDVSVSATVPAFSTVAPVTGVIWASSIGWLSLGGANGGNVEVNTNTGALSGYAWASNIGYINFDPEGTAPDSTVCPGAGSASSCATMDIAALSKNKKVDGWARACSVLTTSDTTCSGTTMKSNTQRGGWDGWIQLYANQPGGVWEWTNPVDRSYMGQPGVPYDPFGFHGVFYDDLLGFAWGGMVVGWIDFFGANVVIPVPVLNVRELQLDFGDVWVGTTKDMDFTVENIGDLGSFLRGLTTVLDTSYFTCVNNCDYTVSGIPVGFPRLVTIRFTPGMAAASLLSTQVTFTGANTDPASSITRDVIGNAIIPVFGNDLNFGNVVVGRYRDLVLTFENAGNINLCTGLSGDPTPCPDTVIMPLPEYTCSVDGGASFQATCPANLAPGVENNIIIRFTPTAVAAFNGEAYLQNNDTVRFMFTGNGVLGTFQFKDQ